MNFLQDVKPIIIRKFMLKEEACLYFREIKARLHGKIYKVIKLKIAIVVRDHIAPQAVRIFITRQTFQK